MISIAVLLTCFNRKDKTLSCLRSLFQIHEKYSLSHNLQGQIPLVVYLTDDGCTDGTADAVRKEFHDYNINILQGDGNLFWAGGMRLAWNAALKDDTNYDYYLLLNDDTDIFEDCFDELFKTKEYCINKYGQEGMYSGACCAKYDHSITSYGGDMLVKGKGGTHKRVIPNGTPQMIDMTNANILLVSKNVVDKIGIFYKGYHHSYADSDYAMQARKNNIPVLLTAKHCGACDYDHPIGDEVKNKILSMSLKERKAYFRHPLHSNSDHLKYTWRNLRKKYPITLIFRLLNVYWPSLYYKINDIRSNGKDQSVYK